MEPVRKYSVELILLAALAASVGFFGYLGYGLVQTPTVEPAFSGEMALADAEAQMAFGPRVTGSEAHRQMGDWLVETLRAAGWEIFIQPFPVADGIEARNIIAVRGEGPVAILGAHYDSRLVADRDPDPALRGRPVPGANDGASGVAVLTELARTLNVPASGHTVCLVFFDAEDNGRIPGWDWILGSRYFVANLDKFPRCDEPRFAVIVDMIGDADQQVYLESNSSDRLTDAIWGMARDLGYGDWIIPEYRYRITDDHIPFLEAGFLAADMIDFDYPYWHTTQDTLDKLSAESLERIGRTLEVWLEAGAPMAESSGEE